MHNYRIDFNGLPWRESAPNVRTKTFADGDSQIRLVEFSKGFVEPDWCLRGHIGYVLEGRFEVSFSGNPIVFEAGDGVFIPAGDKHKHKAHVLTDKVTLVLVEKVPEP
jgi:quercetin dioxygenase-like cupin family protein